MGDWSKDVRPSYGTDPSLELTGTILGLSEQQLRASLDALGKQDKRFGTAIKATGYPVPRQRDPGYTTLLRTIVGQQVSVAAAASVWNKLEAQLGEGCAPEKLIAEDFDALRACGLSRQKQGYARSLAELVITGALPLDALPADDEEAIAYLTRVKGIGRWSAEIYLLFAEGRADIWPAGDLAVQEGVKRILGLAERPSEKAIRDLAEDWRPHRGAAAIFTWHVYAAGFEAI
jgi:DNA-3-methyladenine glycosylase II